MNNIYKKLSVFLMFLSMVTCLMVNMDSVKGDSFFGTLTPGSHNSGGGGGGGTGYSRRPLAFGYRISLVSSKDGTRVHGTDSVDYWSKNQDNGTDYVGYQTLTGGPANWNTVSSSWNRYYLNDNKLTKQEVANLKKFNPIVTTDYARKFFKTEYNKKNEDMKLSNGNLVFDENVNCYDPEGFTMINSYVKTKYPKTGSYICANTTGNYFANNAAKAFKTNFFDKDTSAANYDWKALNQYLRNCGYNKKTDNQDNVLDATSNGIVLQLEPIMITAIGEKVYIGSLAEIFAMWSATSEQYYNYGYESWNSHYTDLNPIVYAKKNSKYTKLAGITLSDGNGLISYKNNYNTSALGVVLFNLSDYITPKNCSTVVIDSINKRKFESEKDKIAKDYSASWLKNYTDYGFSNTDELEKYLKKSGKESCPEPICDEVVNNFIKFDSTHNLNRLINADESLYGSILAILSRIDGRVKGYRKNSSEKARYLLGLDVAKLFDFTPVHSSVPNQHYCMLYKCDDILSQLHVRRKLTKDNIDKLYDEFVKNGKTHDLLDTSFLQELYGEPDTKNESNWWNGKVSCGDIPECPVSLVTASCQEAGKNTFTLKDTDDKEHCLSKGIAYSSLGGGKASKSTTQTSRESEYGKNGYCKEEVTFKFPTSVTGAIAGEVFKWGTDGDKDTSKFGEMIVKRTCYIDKAAFNSKSITVNWLEEIEPTIIINYEEALPKKSDKIPYRTNSQLQSKLANFQIYSNNYTTKAKTYYIIPNAVYMGDLGITWDSLSSVTVTATYNLNYGPELHWYSDKGDSYKNKSEKELGDKLTDDDNVAKKSYEPIGYGLPTSFVTPTNLKLGVGESYGYSINSTNDKNGKLYATISHIGTKSGDRYHFDRLVNFAIKDDNPNTNKYGKIYYSCGFNIQNQLFGYEDGDCEDGKCEEEPKGIDVVFRTIELINSKDEITKAFPGMSGKGRNIGANWAKYTNDKIAEILSNTIYNQAPMYHIVLDVPLIQEIREYNKAARKSGIDPYSDMKPVSGSTYKAGHTGYFYQAVENGIRVKSRFLTYLYETYSKGKNPKFESTCFTDTSTVDKVLTERNSKCYKNDIVEDNK